MDGRCGCGWMDGVGVWIGSVGVCRWTVWVVGGCMGMYSVRYIVWMGGVGVWIGGVGVCGWVVWGGGWVHEYV